METTELRIGNFINDGYVVSGFKDRTIWIEPFYIEDCHTPIRSLRVSQLNPILLTEGWLEGFGFEKGRYDGEMTLYATGMNYNFTWSESKGIYLRGFEKECEIGGEHGNKYVHQLQNLYFALTGKDLELNSKPFSKISV